MRVFILLTGFLIFSMAGLFFPPAHAVEVHEPSEQPRCFKLHNNAPYTVYGSLITEYYMARPDSPGRHRMNFRFEPGEQKEFCSYGPFYGEDKDQLELVLRTLIPVFNCYVRAEGVINIYGRRKHGGGTQSWASCVDKNGPDSAGPSQSPVQKNNSPAQ